MLAAPGVVLIAAGKRHVVQAIHQGPVRLMTGYSKAKGTVTFMIREACLGTGILIHIQRGYDY